MRCADLDLDAIFDEVMIPVSNYSPWEQVEEIMKLGILSPGCSLCAIFGHCSDIDETMWTYDVPGEFSYSLLKCSSRAILEHNAVDSGNAWIPENFLTVCWRWSDDGDKRLYDYYEQGFFVQYDPNIRPANFAAEALSQKVNFPLLCSWYNQCKETHDDCHDDADWQPVTAVFMIDCDNRKVIPRMPNMRYAALSYVWGAAALESRPSVNLDISISLPSPLPKLIEDAIVATKALSLKYLWVDRYCISDIDQELKHRQITHMDQIYSHADLTLIAVVNTPDEGLPGVNNTLRPVRPSGQIGKHRFANTMRDPVELIKKSKWNQRGWTFQEAVFSKRKLFFTKEQVVFQCGSMFRGEFLDRSLVNQSGVIEDAVILPTWQRRLNVEFGLKSLELNISDYCSRYLTFESDALNAFRGILNHYARTPHTTHQYWGLLISLHPPLHSELNSSSVGSTESFHLKKHAPTQSLSASFVAALSWGFENFTERRPNFPSWTWVGWHRQPWASSLGSADVSEVKVWIETVDREIHSADDFARAGGFGLPQSQLSPYVHLEALTTRVRVLSMDARQLGIEHDTLHWKWVEFIGKDGSFLYAQAQQSSIMVGQYWNTNRELSSKYRLKVSTTHQSYVAILMGVQPRGVSQRHVFLLVEEHEHAAEKVGAVKVLSKPATKHDKYGLATAVRGRDGVFSATECFDMEKLVWTKRRIKLG